jgi:hypothetical protein
MRHQHGRGQVLGSVVLLVVMLHALHALLPALLLHTCVKACYDDDGAAWPGPLAGFIVTCVLPAYLV